jgi:hydroxymethylbilane synthase
MRQVRGREKVAQSAEIPFYRSAALVDRRQFQSRRPKRRGNACMLIFCSIHHLLPHMPADARKHPDLIRIASRESRLAMAQSEWISARLRQMYPACRVEIVGMTTRGDEILDKPLALIGGKGLFIKELEVALEEGRADIAVHSMKDVPMTLPDGFAAVVVGEREDVRDAFVSNQFAGLELLPKGARVGTSSLRRESQLRFHFPHLTILPLRGNVNTRLRKLDEGEFDAIILAAAGLRRLGMGERIRQLLDEARFIPAIAQGALGIEFLANRKDVGEWLAPFAHEATSRMVDAERSLGRALTGSCDVPLGGRATIDSAGLHLEGFVALPDGSRMVRDKVLGHAADADALGVALAQKLLAAGAAHILATLKAATLKVATQKTHAK